MDNMQAVGLATLPSKMNQISAMDFNKTCRTCLVEKESGQMYSIYDFDEDQQFAAMIAACSKTEVKNIILKTIKNTTKTSNHFGMSLGYLQ